MKKSYIIYSLLITGIFSLLSCKKLIEIDLPRNQITTDVVFSDSANTHAAITGIYISMTQSVALDFCSGGITLLTGLSSDELYQTGSTTSYAEFFSSQLLPTNVQALSQWSSAFNYIYTANTCIEEIGKSKSLTVTQRNAFLGEVHFIRAWMYFNLVNLYGDVPLILGTDYQVNRLMPRSPKEEVYRQIVKDLEMAKSMLPKNSIQNTRAGYYATAALLSRVYLYLNDYQKALEEANILINSGTYQIEANLDNVFLTSSKEIIYGLAIANVNRDTWEGYYFVPAATTSLPAYVFTNAFYDSFDTDDQRKHKWTRVNVNAGKSYPIPFKYKLNATVGTVKERYSVLRLAEQYLIRAEAKVRLNDLTGAESDVNVIRKRAGLTPISLQTSETLLSEIHKQRKFELMAEWGHRWFDLKRSNWAQEVIAPLKPNWNAAALLFPIPQSEIDRNVKLTQNEGY